MVMLLAERFSSTVAPASAPSVLGGIGTQRSSQISAWTTRPGTSSAANSRSGPNGASTPPMTHGLALGARAGGEVPVLVELAVVRQVDLRDHAEQPAAVDDDGACCRAGRDGAAARRRRSAAAGGARLAGDVQQRRLHRRPARRPAAAGRRSRSRRRRVRGRRRRRRPARCSVRDGVQDGCRVGGRVGDGVMWWCRRRRGRNRAGRGT